MTVNGLGIILFQYADWLQQKGYGRNTIHLYRGEDTKRNFKHAKRQSSSETMYVVQATIGHLR